MGRPITLPLDKILSRATRLFWEKGADDVSTRELEAVIGLRAPAIYRRFPSKHVLLARSIDYYVDTVIVGRIQNILVDAADPMQGLHDFFTSTLKPFGRESQFCGCLLANTATHADGQVPEVHDAIQRGWRVMDAAFQRQIVRAQRAGQLRADFDPVALSQALLISLQGLLTLVRTGRTGLRSGIDMTFSLLGWSPPPPPPPAHEPTSP